MPKKTPMDDLSRIRLKVKDDKRYKKIRALFKTEDLFQLPLAQYSQEVDDLFAMRKVRSLSVSSPKALDKLAESVVQDQSYRSRMTEILAILSESYKTLTDLLSRFQDYVTVAYGNDLKAIGAAKERERAVKNIMADYYRYCDNLGSLIAKIDLYVKDIDKAGYAFKTLVDTLGLINQREYGLPNRK
ncbi:hypothetical protein HOU08_gp159 [Dickeya phage vB_DsoM_JA29]|uniref:Uncharacterized protein n=1 Tax=Dickeya phage vB_DsoM_JA29 TaxID=2283031 RepID=A0A384ZXE5_9CAUD|nr:hypothetical protein HOU08_gp159 [Dickeya phage vB_DsoM_JA29]AXG66885.1 hypothetical protein JA29_159 [Dickeya phage vB_DsoM_JA29]